MVDYMVEVSPLFQEKLQRLDKGVQTRAKKELANLPNRNHKKEALKYELVGFYSHHFWNNKYRIIYTIEKNILKILALWVGKKDDNFYEDVKKYLKKIGKI